MCELTESVQIALITLASGAIGAIVGVIGMIVSAKYNSSAQMRQTVVQEYFKQRTSTFSALLVACEHVSMGPCSDENIAAYLEAKQLASLVASKQTHATILKYHNITFGNGHTDDERSAAYIELVHALQSDLLNYTEPSVKKV